MDVARGRRDLRHARPPEDRPLPDPLYQRHDRPAHRRQPRALSILSRLPLWYARYKPEIGTHFPKGHWQSYALWQFASQANCSARSCPYRVPGTQFDIDVNVASLSAEELRKAWPFGNLLDVPRMRS